MSEEKNMNPGINPEEEVFSSEEAVKKAVEEAKAAAEAAAENEDLSEAAEAAEETAEESEEETKAPEAEDGNSDEAPKKKGFFGKKKDKKDEQIEELTDKVRRQLAEFDNFRKRTEKEKAAMFEVGAKSVIEKILPVIDNFERGLASVPEDKKEDPFVQGMEMTYKQLMTTLESLDVKPIEAVGAPFDPNLHNAVMHVDDENLGENVVAQEFQKGYTYRDTVVRHSMVQVAN